MIGKASLGMLIPLLPLLLATPSHSRDDGGDVYWHIDPSVKECSMVIDPSLTQSQWRKFTRETGDILSFKSLASAEPLGKLNFALGMDYSITPIDQRNLAWINTFTHPDEKCPLGDEVELPTIRGRVGVSNTVDVGLCWTKAAEANYGLLAGELKYAFLRESKRAPAVAAITSIAVLTGVPDFDLNLYSVGFLASKRIARVKPYLGFRESLAVGTETTNKVDLKRENLLLTQGFFGAAYSIWRVGLAAEYNLGDVNTFALLVDFHPRAKLP